ncbi:MAG: metallophosphoesterase [Cyanobacteria bacterium]|nr:metallophosphoesterase [Cyanobacteriota bacterium]
MKRTVKLASMGVVALGAAVWAYARWEAGRLRLEHKSISLVKGESNDAVMEGHHPRLNTIYDGEQIRLSQPQEKKTRTLRILHLSDLHLTRKESPSKLNFLNRITDDDYDLVVLTGDIFQDDESIIYAPYLISRRPRLGAFAVLGNHDYYRYSMFNKIVGRLMPKFRHPTKSMRDVEPLVAALKAVGYEVLRNQSRYLKDDDILIVGADFPEISPERLVDLVESAPESALKMALFHIPKNLHIYENSGIDVAFGGHTHGGQIRVPALGAIITDSDLGRKEASGLVKRGNTVFHVSRGAGADPRTNIRIFCPPEASVIELTYVKEKTLESKVATVERLT